MRINSFEKHQYIYVKIQSLCRICYFPITFCLGSRVVPYHLGIGKWEGSVKNKIIVDAFVIHFCPLCMSNCLE
jgi:hypothetical protein